MNYLHIDNTMITGTPWYAVSDIYTGTYASPLSKLEELRARCEDTVERKEKKKKPRPITDKEVLAVVDEVNNALKYERERVDKLRDKIERMEARGFFARVFNW